MLDVVLVPEGQAVAGLYEVITRDRDKLFNVNNIKVCVGGLLSAVKTLLFCFKIGWLGKVGEARLGIIEV